MSKKISELIQRTPDGQEYLEVIIPPFTAGTNRKVLLSDILALAGGSQDLTDVLTEGNDAGGLQIKNVAAGTLSGDAIILSQLTAAITAALEGLKWKDSVKVSTTVNGTLATAYENGDTVDGVALVTGDRILLKNQTTQTENGIYIVAASGAPSRSSDANSAAELEGATVTVQQGTSNANTTWTQTTDGITLGVSNIVWAQFGSSVPDASDTVKGIVELATPAEVITGTDTTRSVTPEGLQGKVIGIKDEFISAAAMWPRVTGGCAFIAQSEMTTSLFNILSLDFDQTTQEFAQCQMVLPRSWDNGTITAVVHWTAAAGSGGVVWGISGGAYSDGDLLTVALGTAQTATDTLIAVNDLHTTPATAAITIAGTPADGDFLAIQISRNPADGSDTLNADAKLLGITIRYTRDAAKDA